MDLLDSYRRAARPHRRERGAARCPRTQPRPRPAPAAVHGRLGSRRPSAWCEPTPRLKTSKRARHRGDVIASDRRSRRRRTSDALSPEAVTLFGGGRFDDRRWHDRCAIVGVPRKLKPLPKVLSIAGVIRRLEGETDELEALATRLRHLAYHLDRHRARALKRRRRRRAS